MKTLKELFYKFISEYSLELNTAKSTQNFKRPFADIVRKDIPEKIQPYINSNLYIIKGSVGVGRWTDVPWIAIFDNRITTSAQKGVYIVYLLNKNTQELYLTLNQGATDISHSSKTDATGKSTFTGIAYKNNPKTTDALKTEAKKIYDILGSKKGVSIGEINSGSNAYDAGCIYSKKYTLSNLPNDETLISDLNLFIAIYQEYYNYFVAQNNSHLIGKFDSWEIIDETTAIKTCDKSFFEHNGSGVPKGICWFFDTENMTPGETKLIDLLFEGKQYKGRIANESSDRRRVRIFWNTELGNLFALYNVQNAVAIFKKIAENTYTITLETPEEWWPSKEEYDPGITKEKWLELLNNPEVFTPNRLMMMAQYYAIGGRASCAQMESSYGISSDTYRMSCGVHLAEKIHKVTGCPLCNQENAKFWPVLFVGRETKANERGNFMWRLRDELKAALEEFDIMRYLDISGGEEELSVKDTITNIKNYIAAKGFSYNDGMIENFYLSIKSKPFVILAGTSGTGKTRLVKLFAEAVGATTSNGRYKMVSVRPDWSDSSDLFGHVSLNDEFIPGVIIDFIRKASFDEDCPYFLCLDEMNLARVEYYLSDILSIIETRDFVNGKIQSDPLVPSTYYGPDLTAAGHYGTVRLPENLYIIGTVNMDETTFPFSRKVLDRANTIEFSYVDLMPNFDQASGNIQPMDLNNAFLKTEYLLLNQCVEEHEAVNTYCLELQKINQILQKANAHVGYRVRDEIVFYLLNNKKYNLIAENDAMDNELMQKILPRIQGSSMSIKAMLCELFKLCAGDYDGYQAQSDNISDKMKKVLNDKTQNIKYRHSAEKIELMTRRFEEDGFTSYWL